MEIRTAADIDRSVETTLRILVVDDEPMILLLMDRILRKAGHVVTVLDDPIKALESLRANPSGFDLLITDQNMPKMSGVELYTHIRGIVPDMPVVLSTGYGDAIDLQDNTSHLLLAKPYTPAALIAAIREVIAQRDDSSN